jgi:hypothetical protein
MRQYRRDHRACRRLAAISVPALAGQGGSGAGGIFEAAVSPPILHPDRPVSEAVEDFLIRLFEQLSRDGGAIRSLIAASITDSDFARGFGARFVQPRERMVTEALEEAVRRGELAATLDVNLAATIIHGAFWYRLLNRQVLDEAFAKELVAMVFHMPLQTK